jgi:hypothetical protein
VGDFTRAFAPAITACLLPGESVLVASPLTGLPATTQATSIRDELVNLLDPTILAGLGSHPGNLLIEATFGRSATGPPDAPGQRLFAAVEACARPYLALTRARLLIMDGTAHAPTGNWRRRWFGPVRYTATLALAVPRTAIATVVRAPRPLLPGRLLVVFTDGSTAALACPFRRQADIVTSIITGGGTG